MRGRSVGKIAAIALRATVLLAIAFAPSGAKLQQVFVCGAAGVSPDIQIRACTVSVQSNEAPANRAVALFNRGNAFVATGNFDQGIADYSQVIQLTPDYAPAYAGRCTAYNFKDSFDSAIADCNRALQLDPTNTTALYGRGYAFTETKDFDQAIADFTKAIQLNPDFAPAHAGRCNVYNFKDNFDPAIADCNRALQLDPTDSVSFYNLGYAFTKKKDFDQAIADYTKAIQLTPDYAPAYAGRCSAYSSKGNFDPAIADCNRALQINPGNATAFYNRGASYSDKGNLDQAVADFGRAIQLDPSFALAYLGRGKIYKGKNERSLALADFDNFIRLQSKPTINIAFPSAMNSPGIDEASGIVFARPPLPELAQLQQCKESTPSNDAFYQCVVSQALPSDYRIAQACLSQNQQDRGRALICSTQRQDLINGYDTFRSIQSCAKKQDNWAVAQCMGKQVLDSNEQYYLECVTANRGQLDSAAVCALAKNLTPEQQIALSCALSTGGQPHAFVVCTGGRLLERELEKCWQNGIHTENGCFGPNNEYYKLMDRIDDAAKHLMGDNSDAYKAWKLWKNNVLAPGPNGEVVKFINDGIHDVREGPGENNEIVKFGNAIGGAIQGIGNALGF
jgi:tetratricopeptide (TPR) repeat protein